jgi:hypothetical protein
MFLFPSIPIIFNLEPTSASSYSSGNIEYIFAGGETTKKTYQYWSSNMTKKSETIAYGTGDIQSIIEDDTYVYVSGGNPSSIKQYWKSNMTYKTSSSPRGGTINSIVKDSTYIYAGGLTNYSVQQYWLTNLTEKSHTATYGGTVTELELDSTYLYLGGGSTQTIWQVWFSNMTKKGNTISTGSNIQSLAIDDTYVYCGCNDASIHQYWKSNLTQRTTSVITGLADSIGIDKTYLYAGGTGTTIYRIWKSNITIKDSVSYGGNIHAIEVSGNYIYVGGATQNKVFQYWKSNLTKKSETASYGGVINSVSVYQPYEPSGLTATRYSNGFILTWTKGASSNYTVIRGKIGSYPSSPTSDSLIYNGTGSTENHLGLSMGDVWYYRAWSFSNWSIHNYYSTNYSETNKLVVINPTVTTNDSTGVETTNATLQGYLDNDGGENCTVGFEWGTTTGYGNTIANSVDYTYIYNNYHIKVLTSGTSWVIPQRSSSLIDVLVVAGGGGSGKATTATNVNAGGGGGGGFIWITNVTRLGAVNIIPGNTISYSVGNGGAGSTSVSSVGGSGVDSTFGNLTAKGGGGGASSSLRDGINGGSGGGAGRLSSSTGTPGTATQPLQSGWSGLYGYGNDGASCSGSNDAGGGGGAGGAGSTYYGGIGINMSAYFGMTYGVNGLFSEGGRGGKRNGIEGVANTGNGGSGRSFPNGADNGYNGGSGIIIIRFKYAKNFNYNLITLSAGTLYHYRAMANNSNGTVYGSDKTFLTKPTAPSGLTITKWSTGFNLTFTKSILANNTVIRGKIGSYPTSPTGDTLIYNGTGTTAQHLGLTGGDTWYYRAWSWETWAGLSQYSSATSDANKLVIFNPTVTTNASTGIGSTNATIWGYLQNDGGEDCTVGFEWGTTTGYGNTIFFTDPFIYVAGQTTNKVYQCWKSNMTKRAETASYGSTIYAITEDDNYVYAGGDSSISNYYVYQYYKSNMTIKAQTASYGGAIYSLAEDDTYIYAGGSSIYKVYQYWKSNMTKKAETGNYGARIRSIIADDTYIYAGGETIYKVYQYWKSNLTKKAETSSYGGIIYELTQDDSYIYVGGRTPEKIFQYWKSNLTKKAESSGLGGYIYSHKQDTIHIYAVISTVNKVYQLWKSNLTKKTESLDYGDSRSITLDGTYIYFGGIPGIVYQCWKSNLTKKAETASYGGYVFAVSTLYGLSSVSGDTFSYDATGLSPGTLYHYRAVANNSNGTGYGNDRAFVTSPTDPTGLTVETIGNEYHINWTTGTGFNTTVLCGKIGSYPTNPQDSVIYNGTGHWYNFTPTPHQHYYFKAWGYASWGTTHQFSTNYTSQINKPEPPKNFTVNITVLSPLSSGGTDYLFFIKGANANGTTIIYKSGSYPTTITDGTIIYNSSATSYSFLGGFNTNRFLRAWSYCNATNPTHHQNSNIGLNLTATLTYSQNKTKTGCTYATVYGYLITEPGTRQYNFSYGQTSFTSATTKKYRNTTGEISYNITGLLPGKKYQYRSNANDLNGNKSIGNLRNLLTRPYAPTNYNYHISYSIPHINFTWTKGTGANRTVIVLSSSHYPTTPTDGTIVYNGTGTYYNTTITPGTPSFHSAFSYTNWTAQYPSSIKDNLSIYSSNYTILNWSSIGVNCFNESNPSQALTFNIQFKNENGTVVYTAYNLVNTYFLNISEIPNGVEILIKCWATGYHERLLYLTVTDSMLLNLSFYLPPIETQQGEPGDCTTRTAINSINLTYTGSDVTITFSHIPTDIISVERYNSSIDRTRVSYTDTATVTSYYWTHNLYITLTNTLASIISVEVYNKSVGGGYGGWMPVATSNYTYISANNTMRISHYSLASNTTFARVNYYYWEQGTYGAWQFIPETQYSWNSTTLLINSSALDSYITMARVTYNWLYCPGQETTTTLYYIRIVETIKTEYIEFDRPIENARVWVQAYINTTGKYENVSILLSDSNGYCSCWLIPNSLYQLICIKEDYERYRAEYQPPPPNQYGQSPEKLIRLVKLIPELPVIDYEELMDGITWSIEPLGWRQTGAFTVWFNITSSSCQLEWYRMQIYHYNFSTNIWTYYGEQNGSNACGGSLSFNIPNISGRWSVEAMFKKENFSAYEVIQEGSGLDYVIEYLQEWVIQIPDMAYYFVLIVITLFIMGFCMIRLGTGLLTGYIGLGVMALGILLHPFTINITQGFNPSGWVVWGITFLVYTIGLFLWSRI